MAKEDCCRQVEGISFNGRGHRQDSRSCRPGRPVCFPLPRRAAGLWKEILLLLLIAGCLTACSAGRRVLPEGTTLLSRSPSAESDSLSAPTEEENGSSESAGSGSAPSWQPEEDSSQTETSASEPAGVVGSISDFSPASFDGEVGGQAEYTTLCITPAGLEREQLTLVNDNPEAVAVTQLSFEEEGEKRILLLRFPL